MGVAGVLGRAPPASARPAVHGAVPTLGPLSRPAAGEPEGRTSGAPPEGLSEPAGASEETVDSKPRFDHAARRSSFVIDRVLRRMNPFRFPQCLSRNGCAITKPSPLEPATSCWRGHGSLAKPDPSFVVPEKAGIQNFPTILSVPSVWHGPSGFPPSRQ